MTIRKCANGQPPDKNAQCNCSNLPDDYWDAECTCNPGSEKRFSGQGEPFCSCNNTKEILDDGFNCKNMQQAPNNIIYATLVATVGAFVLIAGGYYSYKYIKKLIRARRNNAALFAAPVINPLI